MIRKFLNLYHERQARKPKAFAEIEAQTASGNAQRQQREAAR